MPDPREYDYGKAERCADLVMKGGITSGVIYPHAVCEIARTYRLRNVGGTSAGAIAAALTAAAERGRTSGGFAKLASLPEWLSSDRRLLSLFQPQSRTAKLFQLLTARLGATRKTRATVLRTLRHYPFWMLLGSLPGTFLAVVAALDGGIVHRLLAVLAPAVLMVLGGAAAVAARVYADVVRGIPDNFFGLCTGMPGQQSSHPALTPWLADLLDDVAGVGSGSGPLTFGDLEQSEVNLEMVTTSLSHGRPYRLPMRSRTFFFDPVEFRRLFPERIVAWMETHPPTPPAGASAAAKWELYCQLLLPLRPLPDSHNLPVIVATRLSLSFPGLISAVPLWSVDFSMEVNAAASDGWTRWLQRHREQWPALRGSDLRSWPDRPVVGYSPERCWFSDGGIVSNFPVHFFDQVLPKWPTFAINLRPFPAERPPSGRQANNVWMPTTNNAGLAEAWTRWEPSGRRALVGFGRAILSSMQNWNDNSQLRVPGYRDRVAHVNHARSEGGMNLAMDRDTVLALAERGRVAGEELVSRFTGASQSQLTWDNHRWVRFRSAMALLDQALRSAVRAWEKPAQVPNETPFPELLSRPADQPPAAYHWVSKRQLIFAAAAVEDLITAVRGWEDTGESFSAGAPKESPRLRIMPDW